MSFIFISYARRDAKQAIQLETFLKANGFQTWRDTRNLNPYKDFTGEIEKAIQEASHVIVCLTKDVKERGDSFVRREISYAQARKKPIIPIVFPDGELPIHISNISSFFIDSGTEYDKIFMEVSKRITKPFEELTPKPLPNTPLSLVKYLNDLHEFVSQRLQSSVFELIQLSAASTPNAVESVNFDFDLSPILTNVNPIIRSDTLKNKPAKQVEFDSFDNAYQHYNGQVLLLGSPGSGKTTTLLAFAREMAIRRLSNPDAPIPVLLTINRWKPEVDLDLKKWALAKLPEKAVQNNEVLYLFDGLDELSEDEVRRKFISLINEQFAEENIVVTSRISDYEDLMKQNQKLKLFGAATLLSLNSEQIMEFAWKKNRNLYYAFSNENLRDFANTPLVLTLLTICYNEKIAGEINEITEANVYDMYIRFRFMHESIKKQGVEFSEEATRWNLGYLSIERKIWPYIELENAFSLANAHWKLGENAPHFLDFAIRMNFIYKSLDGNYQFLHRSFRDHCATYLLVKDILIRGEEDWEDFKELRGVIDVLRDLYIISIPMLEKALSSNDNKTRYHATLALGYIGDEGFQKSISGKTPDFNTVIRKIFPIISNMLKDSSWLVRSTAAKMLGKFNDKSAIPLLLEATKDNDRSVSASAAKALENLGYNVVKKSRSTNKNQK